MSTHRSSGFGCCVFFVMLVSLLLSSNASAQATKEPIRIGMDIEMTGVMSETIDER